jgi:phosphatidylethanolamine N-methyltransferase
VQEYHNKTIAHLFFGSPRLGCYFLSICIFSMGILQDHLYIATFFFFCLTFSSYSTRVWGPLYQATHLYPLRYLTAPLEQPYARILPALLNTLLPVTLFVLGQTFVVTSTWALGIMGTFLGDYFGILMDHCVEGFPFNMLRNPMYVSSMMCFAATALWCMGVAIAMYCTREDGWYEIDISFLQV